MQTMDKFKKIILKFLSPCLPLIFLLCAISTGLLVYVFSFGKENTLLAYISYVISAYTLVVVCFRMPHVIDSIKKTLYSNRHSKRFLTDGEFRAKTALRSGLTIRLIYSAFKFISGIVYRSVWFGAEAIYHLLIGAIQFLAVRIEQKKNVTDLTEWSVCRVCGVLMLLVNSAISAVVFMTVFHNEGYVYPGIIIYATAAYTFYRVISTIIQMVKFRKINKPMSYVTKVINFSASLMSLFALQTAMLTQFGDGTVNSDALNIFTGAFVCATVVFIAIYMIIRSTIEINKTKT